MVMKGVTGAVLHGRVTAVMGPSGAGKVRTHTLSSCTGAWMDLALHVAPSCLPALQSTFLTTLASKATYGNQTGVIRINGAEPLTFDDTELARFRNREMGFIFQDHHPLGISSQYSIIVFFTKKYF